MTPRLPLSLLLALAPIILGDEPAKKESHTLKVGNELPFLVADFVAGPHKGHCGCPSVMISNHDARGMVIWTKTADTPAIALAEAIEGKGVDGKKLHGYLIAFDTPEDKLAAQVKKNEWKGVTVGTSRHDSALEFKKWNLDAKTAYVVFLVEKKQIKQMWVLTADELTKDKSEAILKEATRFLQADAGKK